MGTDISHRLTVCTEMPERLAAAADARAWGYPREIDDDEERGAHWIRYGRHAMMWFQWLDSESTGDLVLHVCVHPEKRGRIYPRKFLRTALIVAEMVGARRLVFAGAVGREPVRDYLTRLGWEPDGPHLVHVLPERIDYGEETTEASDRS